jgi:hypothetical protein
MLKYWEVNVRVGALSNKWIQFTIIRIPNPPLFSGAKRKKKNGKNGKRKPKSLKAACKVRARESSEGYETDAGVYKSPFHSWAPHLILGPQNPQ